MGVEGHGGRPEQGIGGGAVIVFVRALGYAQVVGFHEQVAVGRSQVEVAGSQGHVVGGQLAAQGRVAGQPRHQRFAGRVGRQVLHYQHGGRQRGRQLSHQAGKRGHTAGRGANDDKGGRKRRRIKKQTQGGATGCWSGGR